MADNLNYIGNLVGQMAVNADGTIIMNSIKCNNSFFSLYIYLNLRCFIFKDQ